jgi:hypothetical protein
MKMLGITEPLTCLTIIQNSPKASTGANLSDKSNVSLIPSYKPDCNIYAEWKIYVVSK